MPTGSFFGSTQTHPLSLIASWFTQTDISNCFLHCSSIHLFLRHGNWNSCANNTVHYLSWSLVHCSAETTLDFGNWGKCRFGGSPARRGGPLIDPIADDWCKLIYCPHPCAQCSLAHTSDSFVSSLFSLFHSHSFAFCSNQYQLSTTLIENISSLIILFIYLFLPLFPVSFSLFSRFVLFVDADYFK